MWGEINNFFPPKKITLNLILMASALYLKQSPDSKWPVQTLKTKKVNVFNMFFLSQPHDL